MHVVGGADRRDFDILAVLVQQLAVVGVLLGAREPLGFALAFERIAVDIADRQDVAEFRGMAGIAASLTADSEAGHIHAFVGRAFLTAQIEGSAYEDCGSDGRGVLKELAT